MSPSCRNAIAAYLAGGNHVGVSGGVKPVQVIARELHMSPTTVRRWLKLNHRDLWLKYWFSERHDMQTTPRAAGDRSAFIGALEAWKAQDLDRLMTFVADDILYLINVDGIQVPYAMSAVGKEDLRGRLQVVIATFDLITYTIDRIVHEPDYSRALVHGVYRHIKTGEILDIHLRFYAWFGEDGLLTRVHELHDATYLAAFEQFVSHLMMAAEAHEP